jgi:hypothetical protein
VIDDAGEVGMTEPIEEAGLAGELLPRLGRDHPVLLDGPGSRPRKQVDVQATELGTVDREAGFGYNTLEAGSSLAERSEGMSIREPTLSEICDTLPALPDDQLDRVLRFLYELEQARKPGSSSADGPMAPLYRLHTAAVRTGIPNLAHQHDNHLYGLEKRAA